MVNELPNNIEDAVYLTLTGGLYEDVDGEHDGGDLDAFDLLSCCDCVERRLASVSPLGLGVRACPLHTVGHGARAGAGRSTCGVRGLGGYCSGGLGQRGQFI